MRRLRVITPEEQRILDSGAVTRFRCSAAQILTRNTFLIRPIAFCVS